MSKVSARPTLLCLTLSPLPTPSPPMSRPGIDTQAQASRVGTTNQSRSQTMRINFFYVSLAVVLLVMGFVGFEVLATLQDGLTNLHQTLTTR